MARRRGQEGTFGPLLHAKFHPHLCNVSPLRGEKPQNRPLSKLNTGALHCAQCWSVTTPACSYRTINLPRLVCGTRLLSVQMNQTPCLYVGPGVYPGPGFYLKFYGSTVIILITGWSPELSHIGLCRQDSLHSSQKVCVCSVRQSGEHFGSNHRLPIVRYRKDYAGEHSKLLQLQYSKTVVSLVCIGAVSGLYYSSLDRQSRRKFRATADGVIRFVRY